MKALVKRERGLGMEEIPEPTVGINDVLIRVHYTGISGRDVQVHDGEEWVRKTIPASTPIGHEFVGEIVKTGSNVSDSFPGDIVSGLGDVVCGRCRNCQIGRRYLCAFAEDVGINRAGCFAEYVALPRSNVWRHDADLDREAATLFYPLGKALQAVSTFSVLGEDVLVTGAGPIGIMAASVARHAGARHVVITDPNPKRRMLAEGLDVTMAVDPRPMSVQHVREELEMHEGFGVGLETSGNPRAFEEMVDNMRYGGKITVLYSPTPAKMAIDWSGVIFKHLTIRGVWGREMYETWSKVRMMLESGLDVASVITHRFLFHDYQEAFRVARSDDAGKVILDWRELH